MYASSLSGGKSRLQHSQLGLMLNIGAIDGTFGNKAVQSLRASARAADVSRA
jgi:hypothetical protein